MFGLITQDLPDILFDEGKLQQLTRHRRKLYAPVSNIVFDRVQSAFGIALHMHQPTIPARSEDLHSAGLIGNLQYMLEHPDIGDNHNASVFLQCYSRMSDFIRELLKAGKNPRVMLDYSGNLLWGLAQMGGEKVLDNLKLVTGSKDYHRYVEWLGTMWSHAVVSSTPIPDVKLQIRAWQKHFAAIFGYSALERVKGFSAPEMHLPIHPDVCYEYVKALRECGYEWLIVQEHTIENLDGSGIKRPHFPHRLIAKNSLGQTEEITVLIKTQGSDSKLIGQMQPYYEAKTRQREEYYGKNIPPFVLQIGDGENGGVMMNEFPSVYKQAFGEIGTEGVVAMNGSEYLEFIEETGITKREFIPVQPVTQHRIWEFVDDFSVGAAERAIEQAGKKYGELNLERASWTNDRSWVKDYQDVLDPMNKLSVEFHKRFDQGASTRGPAYQKALLYLLLSQTSCFRYWGGGIWTEYAKEICRRGLEAVKS